MELDDRIRSLLASSEVERATTLVLRELGPELLGFLCGAFGNDNDADEVFSALSTRLWQSLADFQCRCSVRTWAYVLARHEIGRFIKGQRRHVDGRVPISELADVLEEVRRTRSTFRTNRRRALAQLRDELPIEDRTLLILRVDRQLPWDAIALAFAESPETFSDDDRKRESARLRKRFQLVKRRLVARARDTYADL